MKATFSESTRVQVAIYRPLVSIVQREASEFYGTDVKTCQKHTRKGEFIKARKVIHFLCREFVPNCPLTIVGLLTGNGKAFDHSTVFYSARQVRREMIMKNLAGKLIYPEVAGEIAELRVKIAEAFIKSKFDVKLEVCDCCGLPYVKKDEIQ
jgi:hypothetical protein